MGGVLRSGSGLGAAGGGEGEGGKLKAAVRSHSLVAPRGGWRIWPPQIVLCPKILQGAPTANFRIPPN